MKESANKKDPNIAQKKYENDLCIACLRFISPVNETTLNPNKVFPIV
jgi:hypothetical protein